ncbi:MAG: PLP-dependent lyase/thiolase [Candidatus Dormibacteria bacterium]
MMAESVGREGQWVHAELFDRSLPARYRVSLGEGATPLEAAPELGAALGVPELYLKREDLSPTGSHKARSLGLLVSDLLAQGISQAVISSSGNAAVAAAAYCTTAGVQLLSLVSPRTPRVKLEALLNQGQLAVASERPVELLHHAVVRWGMADLRASTNPLGPAAYRGIAAELQSTGDWGAVFTFANSGATALGLHQGFSRLSMSAGPAIHPVEGWPGGELTRPWYKRGETVPAAGIGDLGTRRSRLAPALRRAVRSSGGRGWRIGTAELERMLELTSSLGTQTSWEGLAALAAAEQWARQAHSTAPVAILLTGAAEQLDLRPANSLEHLIPVVATTDELDRLLADSQFRREPAAR